MRVEVVRDVLRIEPALIERLPNHVSVRGMDAIHLASANTLGRLGQTIVTYDKNMAKAALGLGYKVESPGAKL